MVHMSHNNITLISFGSFEKKLLDEIVDDVKREFSLSTRTQNGYIDLSDYFDPARKQYDANRLLKEIDIQFAAKNSKVIGLFNVDLYIPILTFIFGQAFLNGQSGIVSAYRLRNERYGLLADEKVLIERLRKEVIHELGHAFGLIHCQNPVCVMRSSTYVEDIDQKNWSFCLKCKRKLDLSHS